MGFLYSQLFVTPAVPKADLTGQVIIVTGANVGLGFEAAKHLVRLGASNVILGCRDVKKGENAAAIIARTPGAEKSKVEVWPLDLSSFKSVEHFAAKAESLPRLDSVIQNAGILTANFSLMEGNESNLHVNVISPMYMTMLLLPKLRDSAKQQKKDGRVAFVGSEMFMWAKFQEKKLPGNTLENMSVQKMSNMGDR
jgi:NAD(P)-dependent dehydrogenase (short-subunit alcohol dehydrogenase family)